MAKVRSVRFMLVVLVSVLTKLSFRIVIHSRRLRENNRRFVPDVTESALNVIFFPTSMGLVELIQYAPGEPSACHRSSALGSATGCLNRREPAKS